MKYQKILRIVMIALISLAVAAAGVWYVRQHVSRRGASILPSGGTAPTKDAPTEERTSSVEEPINQTSAYTIKVYVCGAVNHVGLYELPEDSRIFDAVEAAGGLSAEANPDAVNQADWVADGERIYIPHQGEAYEVQPSIPAGANGLININTADLATLMTLPGIGQSKAQSIMDYRQKNGSFASVEDILNVSGIGESLYRRMQDLICVR